LALPPAQRSTSANESAQVLKVFSMPLIVRSIDIFPGSETESIRQALQAAAPECASGVNWNASVYEGPDLAGTRVTLEGPELGMVWTPWVVEGDGRYSMTFMRDNDEWPTLLQQFVGQMIRRSL
jgi:hypothetical protein